jgi:hypothetical protein
MSTGRRLAPSGAGCLSEEARVSDRERLGRLSESLKTTRPMSRPRPSAAGVFVQTACAFNFTRADCKAWMRGTAFHDIHIEPLAVGQSMVGLKYHSQLLPLDPVWGVRSYHLFRPTIDWSIVKG